MRPPIVRHGTLSLYAALETHSGEILGKTAPRHTSAEFVDFLAQVVASPASRTRDPRHRRQSRDSQNAKLVDEFPARYTQVHIHFTPTYSSWLNQVEIWFAKIQRQVTARGIFSSVDDLRRKILRYIRHYGKVDLIYQGQTDWTSFLGLSSIVSLASVAKARVTRAEFGPRATSRCKRQFVIFEIRDSGSCRKK